MGSPLIKRLDALYQRAQMVMAVQADHAPFVYIAPWSFMKDECIVKYYPEGNYQEPERITTTLHDALMIAQYYYECGLYVKFTIPSCQGSGSGNHSRSTGCLDKYTIFSFSLLKSHVLLLDL